MARIYVSSTFRDLVDERRAAREAILRLEHHPVGMEDYGATSQAPLEKCLDDVRRCAAYVGIFAWRYGFTPRGRDKSITQLELEAAEEAEIERLVYFSPELENWQNRPRDRNVGRIRRLRESLRERYTSSPEPFRSVEDLKYQIGVDLNRQIGRGRRIPRLLPFLCDRQPQYLGLRNALRKAKAESFAAPVVCVLHGDEYQALGKLLDSLKFKYLPSLLGRSAATMITEVPVRWPTSRRPEDFRQELTMLLAQEVCQRLDADRDDVVRFLRHHGEPVVITTFAPTDSWSASQIDLLRAFAAYWARWPREPRSQPIIVLLVMQYRRSATGWLRPWRDRWHNKRIGDHLDELAASADWKDRLAILPRLGDVARDDVLTWLRSEEVNQLCCFTDLGHDVRELFAENAELPMEVVARELAKFLVKCSESQRRPV